MSDRRSRSGFTMLELLVALVILVTAFTIIWTTFSATLKAWERGSELLDELHHGDFVMEQLVSSLRSTVYFPGDGNSRYGFWMEARGGSYPRDRLSWVTSSAAFLPPHSPYANALHRIEITVGSNRDGEEGVAVEAYSHLAAKEDQEVDTWFVSREVKGLACRTYDPEDESWSEAWEDTNSVPRLVEITLVLEPIAEGDDPLRLQRLVEIPVAPAFTSAVVAAESEELL